MSKREDALNNIWNFIETLDDVYNGKIITKELETSYDILNQVVRNYGKYKKYRVPMNVVRNTPYGPTYCPRCGKWVLDFGTDFCSDCGQALAWGDSN